MNGYHPEERLIDSASLGEEWVDLSFAIGKTPILKRVTGIASPGRLTGVMGPSGSGKTTLLNVLSGRQRTSGYSRTGSNKQEVNFSGEVFARGRPVKTSFFRGKTAFVFQDNALMDSDTPREALQFSAYLRLSRKVSKSKRDDLVEKLLDDLHLQ
ncbi:ABC multidrug transporter AFR1, partial [Durusdinium trenchii]